MSTADSFILAIANQATEDFWVGWLQKYAPEDALGGKNKQSLIFGKFMSFLALVTSTSMALYTEVDFFTLLNVTWCSLWAFSLPVWLGATFFPSIKSPAAILAGAVAFPVGIWYEYAVYLEEGGAALGYAFSASVTALVSLSLLTVCTIVFNIIFPTYDDHKNKMFMNWDAIGAELDRFGVTPQRKGSRMLCKIEGAWKTVQVEVPKARDSLSVLCEVLRDDGSVEESGRLIDVSELKGIPQDKERLLWGDVVRSVRNYFDTPVGTLCMILKPLIFFWVTPLYQEEFSTEDSDPTGFGLPRWAVRYLFANFATSSMLVFEGWVLWRGCDSDGKSVCGTDADLWGKTGVLDLKWSEIKKFGCRRRKTWVLETLSLKQVEEWAATLPPELKGYGPIFTEHRYDGYKLNELKQMSPDEAARHLSDLDARYAGDCHALLREVDNLTVLAEQWLYKSDQYLPPPGTVPMCALATPKRGKVQVTQVGVVP